MRRRTFATALAAAALVPGRVFARRPAADAALVTFRLEQCRMLADVVVVGPKGERSTRFWVDTSGNAMFVTDEVAKAVGLAATADGYNEADTRYDGVTLPTLRFGSRTVDTSAEKVYRIVGRATVDPSVDAQGFLPAHVLRGWKVTIDYSNRTMELADSGGDVPGELLPLTVDPRSAFGTVDATVDDIPVKLLLDTGSATTVLNRPLIDKLIANGSRSVTGAYGNANVVGGDLELAATMVRIGHLRLGTQELRSQIAISHPRGQIEKLTSAYTAVAVDGLLGGNVLRNFRVTIDYPRGLAGFELTHAPFYELVDMVPVTLAPSFGSNYLIDGVYEGAPAPLRAALHRGDRILTIGERPASALSFAEAIDALRGVPGTSRQLTLDRNGLTSSVDAPVLHLL